MGIVHLTFWRIVTSGMDACYIPYHYVWTFHFADNIWRSPPLNGGLLHTIPLGMNISFYRTFGILQSLAFIFSEEIFFKITMSRMKDLKIF